MSSQPTHGTSSPFQQTLHNHGDGYERRPLALTKPGPASRVDAGPLRFSNAPAAPHFLRQTSLDPSVPEPLASQRLTNGTCGLEP